MKKFVSAAMLGAALITVASEAPAQQLPGTVTAVIDTTRIYRECTACVAANSALTAQRTQLQQRAQALGQPLQTEVQSIQTAIGDRTPEAVQQDTALVQRIEALQTRQQAAQQELAQAEQTLQRNVAYARQQIDQRLLPIIQQVMQQRGANVALDVGATLAHAQTINVTDAVLQSLNQQLPSISVTAPPPPAQPAQQQPEGR